MSDCLIAEVLLACPVALKIQWVAGNCFLDEEYVAESCPVDGLDQSRDLEPLLLLRKCGWIISRSPSVVASDRTHTDSESEEITG